MATFTRNYTKKHQRITADCLKIGEMMEVDEEKTPEYKGFVILRSYNCLVCLNDPTNTWGIYSLLEGYKLLPGESVTLTQE